MNVFILYVTLPALFFRILSRTPLEQLAQTGFIAATTLASASAFVIAFVVGLVLRRGTAGRGAAGGRGRGFGNVGYMGPGLALATLGAEAAAPVALIFCFDALLFFVLVPLLDDVQPAPLRCVHRRRALGRGARVSLNPAAVLRRARRRRGRRPP